MSQTRWFRGACVALFAAIATVSAHSEVLWRIERDALVRVDATTGEIRRAPGYAASDSIEPDHEGGAFVRRAGLLRRVDEHLRTTAETTDASLRSAGGPLQWDAATRTLLVGRGAELVRYDSALSAQSTLRFNGPVSGIAAFGPAATWLAIGHYVVRVDGEGAVQETIHPWSHLAASGGLGVLADRLRARLWVIGAAEAVAIDVAAAPTIAARFALPAGVRAVAINEPDGSLFALDGQEWRTVHDGFAASPSTPAAKGSMGVLTFGGDQGNSQALRAFASAIAVPGQATDAGSWYRVARPALSIEILPLDTMQDPQGRFSVTTTAVAFCDDEPCEGAARLHKTVRGIATVDGVTREVAALAEASGTVLALLLDDAPHATSQALSVTAVDGFGHRSATASATVGDEPLQGGTAAKASIKAAPTVSMTSPANNATLIAPASVTLTATAAVTGSTITKVEFFNGTTLVATDTAAPYSYVWKNVAAGKYTLTAKAHSSGGVATSSPVTLVVKANTPPAVAFSAPANNAVYSAPASIALAATATDSDGTIAKVQFFNGTVLIGTVATAPFTFSWSNVPGGTYTLTARATDDKGTVAISAARTVIVNTAPAVKITAPVQNAAYVSPTNITIIASVTDADGSVSKVEFFRGTTLLATDTAAPYSYTVSNAALGTHTFSVKATDNRGAVATSAPVTVTVNANIGPNVGITSPAPGAQFVDPATIPITATATDPDGTITKVEFYYDYGLLAVDTTAPYSYVWKAPYTGDFTLTAKAYDNKGGVRASAAIPITINVNQPPVVALEVSPAAGTVVPALPVTLRLAADARDTDGTVKVVRFYARTGAGEPPTLIGTVTKAPYVLDWTTTALFDPTTMYFSVEAEDLGGAIGYGDAGSYYLVVGTGVGVTMAQPHNTRFVAPATIVLVAKPKLAAGMEGPTSDWASRVEFLLSGTTIAAMTAPNGSNGEYAHVWRDAPVGRHLITVRVTDKFGVVSTDQTEVEIFPSVTPPSIVLTQPEGGEVFGEVVPLAATVTPGGAAIARVDYISSGGSVVATSSAAPWTARWEPVQSALFDERTALTAQVVDVHGNVATSNTVDISIESSAPHRPFVVLTEPIASAPQLSGTPLSIAAEAMHPVAQIRSVQFYANGNLVGIATTPPYRASWANPTAGKVTLIARAIADYPSGATNFADSSISITVGRAPSVALTSPLTNARFAAPATIPLAATAGSSNGAISKVEFFAGTTLLATDTTGPFSAAWTNVPPGTYDVKARATDITGVSAWSSVSTVHVIVNAAPTISLSSPVTGQSFAYGAPIPLAATAADSDGAIAKVDFFDGTTLLKSVTSPPYTFAWIWAAPGVHSITARATDDAGTTATSAAASITVTANALPEVSFVLPANNQTFVPGTTVDVVAVASDPDGSVARVEFVRGATVLATFDKPPYHFRWANLPPGVNSLLARVTDNRGAVRESLPFVVNAVALAINVTAPYANQTVATDTVTVSGTFEGPGASGITVNGAPAMTSNYAFNAVRIPLQEGANTITVVLTAPTGQTVTREISVTRAGTPLFDVIAEPAEGLGPLVTTLRLVNRTDGRVASLSIGNMVYGTFDAASAGPDVLGTISYSVSGVHRPTITITDSTGATHTVPLVLNVISQVSLDSMLLGKWTAFTTALRFGLNELALGSYTTAAASRYARVLSDLGPDLPSFVGTWQMLGVGAITPTFAEYVVRTPGTPNQVFLVYWIRDGDGVWRLDTM